ncbi:unnamed protein product, partial [Coccothraustes coccothraustes]
LARAPHHALRHGLIASVPSPEFLPSGAAWHKGSLWERLSSQARERPRSRERGKAAGRDGKLLLDEVQRPGLGGREPGEESKQRKVLTLTGSTPGTASPAGGMGAESVPVPPSSQNLHSGGGMGAESVP